MRKIQIISIEDKETIREYFYDYLKELSEFDPTIKFDNNGTPIYNWFDYYWIDKDRYPFLLSIDNKFAGFALLREVGIKQYEIAEFYVIPKYRKDNNTIWFATQITNSFESKFVFSTRVENTRAIRFWDKFVTHFEYKHSFIEESYKTWEIKTNQNTEF